MSSQSRCREVRKREISKKRYEGNKSRKPQSKRCRKQLDKCPESGKKKINQERRRVDKNLRPQPRRGYAQQDKRLEAGKGKEQIKRRQIAEKRTPQPRKKDSLLGVCPQKDGQRKAGKRRWRVRDYAKIFAVFFKLVVKLLPYVEHVSKWYMQRPPEG